MVCVVEGCGKKIHCKGLCRNHYNQKWNKEHPENVRIWSRKAAKRYRERHLDRKSKYDSDRYQKALLKDPDFGKKIRVGIIKNLGGLEQYRAYMREAFKKWCRENPADCTIYRQKKTAQAKKYPPPTFTAEQWQGMVDWYQGRCAYCFVLCTAEGKPGQPEYRTRLTCDHVIPLVKGGPNDITNVVPACRSCNSSKGKKLLSDWLGEKLK